MIPVLTGPTTLSLELLMIISITDAYQQGHFSGKPSERKSSENGLKWQKTEMVRKWSEMVTINKWPGMTFERGRTDEGVGRSGQQYLLS